MHGPTDPQPIAIFWESHLVVYGRMNYVCKYIYIYTTKPDSTDLELKHDLKGLLPEPNFNQSLT